LSKEDGVKTRYFSALGIFLLIVNFFSCTILKNTKKKP
jgi:hypothetical protein